MRSRQARRQVVIHLRPDRSRYIPYVHKHTLTVDCPYPGLRPVIQAHRAQQWQTVGTGNIGETCSVSGMHWLTVMGTARLAPLASTALPKSTSSLVRNEPKLLEPAPVVCSCSTTSDQIKSAVHRELSQSRPFFAGMEFDQILYQLGPHPANLARSDAGCSKQQLSAASKWN